MWKAQAHNCFLDVVISQASKVYSAVSVCYTDLSSAVLSKLILGTAAEALLAGLDSGKAGGMCETRRIALSTGLAIHVARAAEKVIAFYQWDERWRFEKPR